MTGGLVDRLAWKGLATDWLAQNGCVVFGRLVERLHLREVLRKIVVPLEGLGSVVMLSRDRLAQNSCVVEGPACTGWLRH